MLFSLKIVASVTRQKPPRVRIQVCQFKLLLPKESFVGEPEVRVSGLIVQP